MTTIIEHNARAVQNATGVERFALRTILGEKNYLLKELPEIHRQAKSDINEILNFLDQVEIVARQYDDKDLLSKVSEVRKITQEYAAYFDEGVQALEENRTLASALDSAGQVVGSQAVAYALDKKTELNNALKEGGQTEGLEDIIRAVDVVTRIEALALETRMSEKAYILLKDEKYFTKIEENINELFKKYDELEKLSTAARDLERINVARKATQEYLNAAHNWVKNDTRLQQILVQMNDIGVKVQDTALEAENINWTAMTAAAEGAGKTGGMATTVLMVSFGVLLVIGVIIFIALRNYLRNVRNLITEVISSSQDVTGSAEQASTVASETSKTTQQIASTAEKVSRGASEQAANIAQASRIVEKTAAGAKNAANNAQAALDVAQKAGQTADEGGRTLKNLTAQVNAISKTIGSSAGAVKGLVARTQQIGDIANIITDIADQTNLLALNAASEHGIGREKLDKSCDQFSTVELEQFERIKRVFDPDGRLNPGKAIPTPQRCAEIGGMHVHQGKVPFPELERF